MYIVGDNSIDDVMTKLLHSLDISNTRKQEDIQTELERFQRENEISEQETAYEQSIRADRERMLKQQEDEDKKRNDDNKQRKEEAEHLKKTGRYMPSPDDVNDFLSRVNKVHD